jgi:hypothetical protein
MDGRGHSEEPPELGAREAHPKRSNGVYSLSGRKSNSRAPEVWAVLDSSGKRVDTTHVVIGGSHAVCDGTREPQSESQR